MQEWQRLVPSDRGSCGVLEEPSDHSVVHLLPRVNYSPQLRRIIGGVLEQRKEQQPMLPDGSNRRLKLRLADRAEMKLSKFVAVRSVTNASPDSNELVAPDAGLRSVDRLARRACNCMTSLKKAFIVSIVAKRQTK